MMEMQLRQTMLPPPPSLSLATVALLNEFWFRTAAPLRAQVDHLIQRVKGYLTPTPPAPEDRPSMLLSGADLFTMPFPQQAAPLPLPTVPRPLARTTIPVQRAK